MFEESFLIALIKAQADPPSAVQWVCHSGIPHHAAGAEALSGALGWGQGAKRLPAPPPLHAQGRRGQVVIPWPPTLPRQDLAAQPCIPEPLSHTAVTPHQETSPCSPPAIVSTPQPARAMPSVWTAIRTSPTENPLVTFPPKPAATLWNFPGRRSCRATVFSLSPQEWAAEMKVLGLSHVQCCTVSSSSKCQVLEKSANQPVLQTWLS